jgi:hypothetical protein
MMPMKRLMNGIVGEIDFSPLREVEEGSGPSWWANNHDD